MTTPKLYIVLFICLLCFTKFLAGQTSKLISLNPEGKLSYMPDELGNIIPDFSGVGYKNSEMAIPEVPVIKTVTPVSGDNYVNIQGAINEVSSKPLQSDGFRGAILFKSGTYELDKPVTISVSGIVIRGEGIGTHFRATGTYQYNLINIKGSSGKTEISGSQKKITDAFVPIGAKKITIESGHQFAVGDWVHVRREPNADWIHLLGMDVLTNYDPAATNWTASSYKISYERQILNIEGNQLTLDAPVMDPIDPKYASGFVVKFNSARIQHCAIENLRMSSVYSSPADENHAWNAIFIDNARDCWVKNVVATDFGYSCVNIGEKAAFITIHQCSMLDPVSQITGSRRYSFNVDGQRCVVSNCTTRNGRHDYVNGSRTPGPTVFYNCTASLQHADMGPHHRWSTGILLDNIKGDGQLRVQDRADSGSGHGWSGAQIMFWNCKSPDIVIQDPPSYHRNWAIGCTGTITNVGQWTTHPIGIVESQNVPISEIPSLFVAQLNERLSFLTSSVKTPEAEDFSCRIYPNPGNGHVNVACNMGKNACIELAIMDTSGRKIKQYFPADTKQTGFFRHSFDLSDVPPGTYFVRLAADHAVQTSKLIIQKRTEN